MSYNRVTTDGITKEQIDAHEKTWGRFNDPPPGFTEISSREFAQSGFFTWVTLGQEFRQICSDRLDQSKLLTPPEPIMAVTMFYMNHGDNYAIANDYWKKEIRYFKFTDCYHNWVEITAEAAGKRAFNCYYYCKCSKCGKQWEYASD